MSQEQITIPKAWAVRLLEMKKETANGIGYNTNTIDKINYLFGYIDSIKSFLGDVEEKTTFDTTNTVSSSPTKKASFKNDKTKDGWELIEDVGFEPVLTSPKQLELLPFLKDKEMYLDGEVMVERAKELKANMGQQHAEWLLEHQSEIPKEFRNYYLVFPGTKWRRSGGGRDVPYLNWRGGEWILNFDWLASRWGDGLRLLRIRE